MARKAPRRITAALGAKAFGKCNGYLSCCCDRMPDTKQLKGEGPVRPSSKRLQWEVWAVLGPQSRRREVDADAQNAFSCFPFQSASGPGCGRRSPHPPLWNTLTSITRGVSPGGFPKPVQMRANTDHHNKRKQGDVQGSREATSPLRVPSRLVIRDSPWDSGRCYQQRDFRGSGDRRRDTFQQQGAESQVQFCTCG